MKKIKVGMCKYQNDNGVISEAVVFYNGVGNNMTFEENGNSHLIYSKAMDFKMAKIVYDAYCKGKTLIN